VDDEWVLSSVADQAAVALEKLRLNDASLIYEAETSQALGFGFRCGFLGLFHLEIIQQRLEREYDMDLIATSPSVEYRVITQKGAEVAVDNPAMLPDPATIEEVREPWMKTTVIVPTNYVGPIMDLAQGKRGTMLEMTYVDPTRAMLKYDMPLSEVIVDFYDQLKSRSQGYASLDYEFGEYRAADLVRLDILVANHGIWPPNDAPIDKMTDEQWLTTIGINLNSVFGLVKHGVAQMKKQGQGGAIVLISSTAGQRGEAFHCDYAATKGAVISMTKGLSTELARDKIRVNCVAPGWVGTDMAAPALEDPQVAPRVFATIPLGRVGTPEELAACIVFLCTEGAGFVTGEVFNVNGGAVLVG